MFSNVGKKIKGVALFFCWVGIIASIVGGAILLYDSYNKAGFNLERLINNNIAELGMAFVVLILGPILSWLLSLGLYGFGELIERVTSIDSKSGSLNASGATINIGLGATTSVTPAPPKCPRCGTEVNPEYSFCHKCGAKLKQS